MQYRLGIEGGGTKTIALLADEQGRILQRIVAGPFNLKLSSDAQMVRLLRAIRGSQKHQPSHIGIGTAGCRTESDRQRIHRAASRIWPKAEIVVGSDADVGLAAAFGATGAGILVISGTGSIVYGRNETGQSARAGGWGHVLGDHGSGYWIAHAGLRHAVREYDRHGRINHRLLSRLGLNSYEQLIEWAQRAGKDELASVADIFLENDPGLMLQAASFLAQDCHAVAGKLGLTKPRVALAGGVLRHHKKFATLVGNRIRTMLPGAVVSVMKRDTAEGALALLGASPASVERTTSESDLLPLTEARNPRTMNLDKQTVAQLVDTMLREESRVVPAVRRRCKEIAACVSAIVAAFKQGGRLFYVGAGTSGRLGVLDASECPPTFSTDPEMVQGIIAGGAPALQHSVEAAEDDPHAGAMAVANRGVRKRDVVVGIAASGRTPFVIGALDEAQRRGARTFLLCFSPPATRAHRVILIETGPEVVTGSTRLKAGTATKIVLNMLTTISLIRLGKVVSNLMVDVKPTNRKLRDRACRIVMALRHCSATEARRRLERSNWIIKKC